MQSSQNLKRQIKNALKKSPEEWEDSSKSKIPKGKHPWHDLYSKETVVPIGAVIGIQDEEELQKLRLILASIAQDCHEMFQFVGGSAANSKKKAWVLKTHKNAKKLKHSLSSSEALFPTTSIITDKQTWKITPKSHLSNVMQQVGEGLDELIEILESGITSLSSEVNDKSEINTPQHDYLKYIVDGVTKAFIHFRGKPAVKRTVQSGFVDGEYPEFVRSAALPILKTHLYEYVENADGQPKLNAQIQRAIKAYKNV